MTLSSIMTTGALLIGCDCPYYADSGPCKHIWAAILEADRRGSLADARSSKYLQLEDDLDSDYEFDEFDSVNSPGRSVNPARYVMPPPPPQPPLWQERLTAVQRMVEGLRTTLPAASGQGEIFYVVDVSASKYSGAITMHVKERTRKKNGDWSVLKSFSLTPARVMAVEDALDSEFLSSMLGSQDYYAYSYRYTSATSGNRVLPPALALKVIPRLAAAGRLWLDNNAYPDKPEPVAWDDGEAWKLWLDVRRDENDQWKITGSMRRTGEVLDLARITLVVEGRFRLCQREGGSIRRCGAVPLARGADEQEVDSVPQQRPRRRARATAR